MQHIAASRRMQRILIGCNKALLEARGTFLPFWAHAAIIRSCQQLPQAQATAAPRAENPFLGNVFSAVPRRPRRSRPSCSPSRRCAEINHSSEIPILAIRSAGPVPGFTEAHPLPRRALPPKPRLLLARHHQRANKGVCGYCEYLQHPLEDISASDARKPHSVSTHSTCHTSLTVRTRSQRMPACARGYI
jgi:hypothetical protein